MLKNSFKEMDLGAIRPSLAPFATSVDVEQRLRNMFNLNIITLGQGGGRKGAEIARFGWDIWMINSAQVDMEEHTWVKNKVFISDPERGNLQGTAKNAAVGHSIAQKNVVEFKKVAIQTQDADHVFVTVALGGGQGNGAIPTATEWISKVREIGGKVTEKGNPTVSVIASIPARDESNPDIWQNALSGLKYLQDLINSKKIGAVLLVDNELIRNYYVTQNPLVYSNKSFSALDYSNIMLARTLFEIMVLPLLSGPVSLDLAELAEIFSTPGWLTINRNEFTYDDNFNLEYEVGNLFKNNEVFASLDVSNSIAGGIALVTGKIKSLPPSIVDQVKPIANSVLGKPSILHSAVIQSNAINDKKSYLLGLAITPKLPESLLESLVSKYNEEKNRKEEKELAALQQSSALSGFDSVYTKIQNTSERKKVSLDDLQLGGSPDPVKKKVTLDDL